MGQFTLLAVFGSFLIGGIVVLNANRSAERADEKVWEHQYHVVARDAAATGMAAAARTLADRVEAGAAWDGNLAAALRQSAVAYAGGTYTVDAAAASDGPDACPVLGATAYERAMTAPGGRLVPQGQILTLTVTGRYQGDVAGDAEQSHQISACYVQTDYSRFAPPAFAYALVSQQGMDLQGTATLQAVGDAPAHVHADGALVRASTVEIDGVATAATAPGTAPLVAPQPFDAVGFATARSLPSACAASPALCRASEDVLVDESSVVKPPTSDPGLRRAAPYLWYIDGDLVIEEDGHLRVPQYTTIVVTGDLEVKDEGAVTVTGATARDLFGARVTPNKARQWAQSQLLDGTQVPVAWFVAGSVTLSGETSLVGAVYANGSVTVSGESVAAGSFASASSGVTVAGADAWLGFAPVAPTTLVEGVRRSGRQVLRLAVAEWTDPVLDAMP